MSRYTERYRTPSPKYPSPTSTTLERLLTSWERLRELDTHGYRTSESVPSSTWLVKIGWADGRSSGRSKGRGTTCSPFTTQATAMAFSATEAEPYEPKLSSGEALPVIFSHACNGALRPSNAAHKALMERYGLTLADAEWPRPVIFFNLGYAVEPEEMRRGDAVHIEWMNGGGHAVFCWDVHLNERGEVDAFSYVSSNGSIPNGGNGGGVSVGGTASGAGGIISQRPGADERAEYFATKTPLFSDDERYVSEGAWVTWDEAVAGKFLTDLRVRPKTKVRKIKRVAVVRFHGVDVSKVPFYAMGQDEPGPFVPKAAPEPEPSASAACAPAAPSAEDVASLQRRLRLLFLIKWIGADPGKVDGKAGRKTTAAVVAFQRTNGLRADGKAGKLTLAKLDAIFQSALDAPQAKQYLNPVQPGGLSFGAGDWEETAQLYFRHGAARPGDAVELILRGADIPQHAVGVTLFDAGTRKPLAGGKYSLQPVGDRATVTITAPKSMVGGRILARLDDTTLVTGAPLCVVAPGQTQAQTQS